MPRPLPDPAEAAAILQRRKSRPTYRAAPPAGKALTPLVRALEARFGKGVDGLKSRWREVAGETLAARTEPVKLVKGRGGAGASLEVKVQGPMAALIQHQAPEILQRVNLFLGEGAVERLRIVQGPVRPPPASEGQRVAAVKLRRRSRGPLDAAQEARLSESLAAAPEGPLKRALLRLGREVLRERR
ncbi:MAG TPA: DciA family protein [Caulobacteraceae bacterium]|jgi:hypothetical protein